jgi:hypothetical protein
LFEAFVAGDFKPALLGGFPGDERDAATVAVS